MKADSEISKEIKVPKKYPRVIGDMDGHYWQWIDAGIAGYGNAEVLQKNCFENHLLIEIVQNPLPILILFVVLVVDSILFYKSF